MHFGLRKQTASEKQTQFNFQYTYSWNQMFPLYDVTIQRQTQPGAKQTQKINGSEKWNPIFRNQIAEKVKKTAK